MRLDLGPSPDYRHIAKWARTSVTQISRWYDQTHPRESVERVTGFRVVEKEKPATTERERERRKQSAETLAKLQKAAREQS
jgi:hypothetical protein